MHAASTLARKPVPLISETVMAFRVPVWRSSLSCQGSRLRELFGPPMRLLEAPSILGDREMGRRKGAGRAPRRALADVAVHENSCCLRGRKARREFTPFGAAVLCGLHVLHD